MLDEHISPISFDVANKKTPSTNDFVSLSEKTFKNKSNNDDNFNLFNVKDLVELVINGSYHVKHFNELNVTDYVIVPRTIEGDTFKDPEREFKDLFTDFVTFEMYNERVYIARFLKATITMMSNGINEYIKQTKLMKDDVIFLYKGGGVLRMLALDYMKEQPERMTEIMNANFSKYFKRSDADFGIYINPKLDNYEKVYDDITNLSYLLLHRLTIEFQSKLEHYFNLYTLKDEIVIEKLKQYLRELNNSHPIKDPESEYYNIKFFNVILNGYDTANGQIPKLPRLQDEKNMHNFNSDKSGSGKSDLGIDITTDKKHLSLYKIPYPTEDPANPLLSTILNGRNNMEFYTSVNRSLRLLQGDWYTRFNLVRTKVNFKAYYTRLGKLGLFNLGGELVDIAITHRDSSEVVHFFEHLKDHVRTFKYVDPNDSTLNFSFQSYSLRYFLWDLEKMLFLQSKYPWNDKKYAKRIYRSLFLYAVNIIDNNQPLEEKVRMLQNFLTFLRNWPNSNKAQLLEQYNALKIREYRWRYLFINETFTKKIGEFINSELDIHSTEVLEFIDIISECIENIISITNQLTIFIQSEGSVKNRIYTVEAFGGYRDKYLKYKTKYHKLKNNL